MEVSKRELIPSMFIMELISLGLEASKSTRKIQKMYCQPTTYILQWLYIDKIEDYLDNTVVYQTITK